MYLISLYFSVIIAKIAVLTPSDEINIIEKVNNVCIPFPIKKIDGKIKNNIIYQVGVSRKKQDLTTLASTEADSNEDKNNPNENKNKPCLNYLFLNMHMNGFWI